MPASPVAAEAAAEEPAPTPASDPTDADALAAASAYGRVDEDGQVWSRTADGERPVGSYPGAPAEEAVAYFARKYLDLVAQVALLEKRVTAADLPVKDADAAIARQREAVEASAVVGDLPALLQRLDDLVGVVRRRQAKADAARARAREQARVVKERLIAEAESLAASTQWKSTGDRFRTLLEEWKAAPRLDRKADDELWKRFSTARTAFDKARRQHFAALDVERAEVKTRKERMVKEAESLAGSTDWGPTGSRLRELMSEWKAAGRAGREDEDALWTRFRAAQDAFFAARNEVFAERDAGQKENLERKLALVAEAEALLPYNDLAAAKRALRAINERWDAVGHVPRGDRDRIEGRLQRVSDALRTAEESEWRRTDPEARARAEATVAMLRTAVEKLEAQLAKDQAAGRDSKVAQATDALAARRSWLAEAERTLADLSR